MSRDGIAIDRNLAGEEQLQEYLKNYAEARIAEVARDTRLTNPKKLDQFPTLSSFARQAALAMFSLRRALEHHQGIPGEEIVVPIVRTGIFVDNVEIVELPAHVREGQQIQVRLVTETQRFPRDIKIALQPEDAHQLIFTLRVALAPEVFRAYLEMEAPKAADKPVSPETGS